MVFEWLRSAWRFHGSYFIVCRSGYSSSPTVTAFLLREFTTENLTQEFLFNLWRTVRRSSKNGLLAAGFFDVFLELFDSCLDFVSHAAVRCTRHSIAKWKSCHRIREVNAGFRGKPGL